MHLRWWMLSLLFFAAAINYIDRQNLSVAAPVIRKLFHMSNTDYGQIVFAFMLAYALMHPVAGWIVDRLGTRSGFALAVIWWSIANMMHAWATGVLSFSVFRFLLGIGEAGLLPASVKAISEWFPKSERALAVGITNVGIGVGAVVSPPLISWLILGFDWRFAFLITGLLGFIWLAAWLLFYRPPGENHLARLKEDSAFGEKDCQKTGSQAEPDQISWLRLLKHREIWGLMLARFLADPVWYFYLFWLPEYLSNVRGFTLSQIGYFAWIPYVAAVIGNLTGGWVPSYLIGRGWSLTWARKGIASASAFLVPVAIAAAFVPEPGVAIALITLAVFLIWIWATTLFTLPADLFPSRVVGMAYGLTGAAGSFGAVLFMPVVGFVVDHFSYTPIFVAVGLLHPVAATVILFTIPKVELIEGAREVSVSP